MIKSTYWEIVLCTSNDDWDEYDDRKFTSRDDAIEECGALAEASAWELPLMVVGNMSASPCYTSF